MKKIVIMVSFAFALAFISSAHAGWLSDISDNQNMAMEYIAECMTGQCPKAPTLKAGGGWKGERARKECITHMKIAYKLAKSGNADRITLPQFQYGPGQRGWGGKSQ